MLLKRQRDEQQRNDARMAHLTVMFYNANRGKGSKSAEAGDFFPSLARKDAGGVRRSSASDMRTKIRALKAHVRAIRES